MRGFTLVELVVALAVSGLVLLGAAGLLVQLADHADRIGWAAREADREANAERLLREAVARMEASADREPALVGNAREARFVTWCDVPAGWQERCQATLAVVPRREGHGLRLELRAGESIEVLSGFEAATLLYLADPARGGAWLTRWRSVTTPLALGVVVDADTVILRIGERG